MKLSFLSDLEAVSEAKTVSVCLMFKSGFIDCGQRLLHNIQGKEQGLRDTLSKTSRINLSLCFKSDFTEQVT